MKTRSKRRVRRKATNTPPARRRPRPRAKGAKALDVALKRLKRAVSVTVSRADSVLASTEAISQLAATRTKSQLLSSLLEDEVLTALFSLSQTEDTSKALRLYSGWLRRHFALEPIYEQGEILEVPRGRLSTFDILDGTDRGSSDIYAIRIVSGGWKQGSQVLRKPVATITEGAAGSHVR